MAGQVVEVEAVTTVPRLVRDAEYCRESRVLRKADCPLVQRTIGMFRDHEHIGGENA